MGTVGLFLLAVTPPVFFLLWILRYDRNEPEPLLSVLRILALGCTAIIPAAILESLLLALPLFGTGGITGAALQSFLVISPVEEAFKFIVVLVFAMRSRFFSEANDGIVYAGAASIGFALAENIFYVLENGTAIGIARALTSIPGHTFTGVIMGYWLGRARYGGGRMLYLPALLVPWFLHGLYDTLVLSETAAALLVIPLVVLYFAVGTKLLRKGRDSSARENRVQPPPEVRKHTGKPGCLKTAGAVLLSLAGLFWVVIILGLTLGNSEGYQTSDVVIGSILITFLPVTAGVILLLAAGKKAGPEGPAA